MSDNLNIDDILLEAKRLKKRTVSDEDYSFDGEDNELEKAFNLVKEIERDTENIARVQKSYTEELAPKEPEQGFQPSAYSDNRRSVKKEKVEKISFTTQPEQPSAPVSPLPPSRPTPPAGPSAKGDIFSFRPRQRENPMIQGVMPENLAGRSVPPPVTPPIKPTVKSDFDFASISNKIDQLNEQEDTDNHLVETQKKEFGRARIHGRYEQLILGKNAKTPQALEGDRLKFNDSEAGAQTPGIAQVEPHIDEILPESQKPKRRSIFGTFATGTGRELKLEDIKKIDFGAVEPPIGGYYDDEDDRYYGDDILDVRRINIGEFLPETDRRSVSRDIANKKMGILIRSALLLVFTGILFYMGISANVTTLNLPPVLFPKGDTLINFLLFCTIMTGLVLVICFDTVVSGIVSLFKMQANADTLVTFAVIGAVVQGIAAISHVDLLEPGNINLFFPVACLVMLFNYIGKLGILSRIQQNFKITATTRERRGILAVENPAYCRDLMPNVTESQPVIAYSVKANFFSDFLSLSFSTKYDVGIYRAVAPVCIGGAIIVGLVTRVFSDWMSAFSAIAGILCISATLSSNSIENIPLSKMAKKLVPMGAMVSGNKAVETFCDTKSVILTDKDLFPEGHIYLNGIKAFPNGRIDEAILDAASVLCALEGALGYVFLDMIGGNETLLKKVDNVVYENNMGLSGWVDGRRVLIGNRGLMKNHSVPLPNDSYERENPRDTPGNPIYLSNSGEVSARFLVEYIIDEQLAYQLDLFAAKEKELIIYTTDANIDANKIWQLYGYPIDLITIMSSELQDEFRQMSEPKEEIPAEVIFTGKLASFIAAILASINARSSILIATILQLCQIILGYGTIALMAFMGYLGSFSIINMVVYQLIWFAVIVVAQQLKKP